MGVNLSIMISMDLGPSWGQVERGGIRGFQKELSKGLEGSQRLCSLFTCILDIKAK